MQFCTPIAIAAGAVAGVGAQGVLAGASIRETAGTAVSVDIYDNTAGSGTVVASFTVPASGSVDLNLLGRRFATGLFVVLTGAGTLKGSIFIA